MNRLNPWSNLCTGLIFVFFGLTCLYLNVGDYEVYPGGWGGVGFIPNWVCCILLPAGIAITAVSIGAIWRNRGKPKKTTVTDEELAQSEADLDDLYFRQYGEMPKKPPKTEETEENPPPGGTEDRGKWQAGVPENAKRFWGGNAGVPKNAKRFWGGKQSLKNTMPVLTK